MKRIIKLEDLDCASCASKMEDAVRKIDGVNYVSVNFITQTMTLQTSDENFDEIIKKVVKKCKHIEPECTLYL